MALAIVVALYAAIGFIVNTKTISLTDEELFVQTRPLPFHRTRRVPVSGIERVRVENEHRSQHTNFLESVVVVEHDVVGREILFKFQDDQPAAQYICDRLLARLDLTERDE